MIVVQSTFQSTRTRPGFPNDEAFFGMRNTADSNLNLHLGNSGPISETTGWTFCIPPAIILLFSNDTFTGDIRGCGSAALVCYRYE